MSWGFLAAAISIFLAFFAGLQAKRRPEEPDSVVTVDTRETAVERPGQGERKGTVPSTVPGPSTVPSGLSWETQKGAFKLTRIMCDGAGLTLQEKDVICACIYQESTFLNHVRPGVPTKFENKDKETGKVWSTDWGICQINDTKGWHIGPGLQFPSVQYVLDHPEKAVAYMIKMQKAGKLSLWSSYKFGHYKKWLSPTSQMWSLRS